MFIAKQLDKGVGCSNEVYSKKYRNQSDLGSKK